MTPSSLSADTISMKFYFTGFFDTEAMAQLALVVPSPAF
jgi:hypothetical protein